MTVKECGKLCRQGSPWIYIYISRFLCSSVDIDGHPQFAVGLPWRNVSRKEICGSPILLAGAAFVSGLKDFGHLEALSLA